MYIYGSYRKIKTGLSLFLDHSVFNKSNPKRWINLFHTEGEASHTFWISSWQLTVDRVRNTVRSLILLSDSYWANPIKFSHRRRPFNGVLIFFQSHLAYNIDWTVGRFTYCTHWLVYADVSLTCVRLQLLWLIDRRSVRVTGVMWALRLSRFSSSNN